MCGFWTMFPNLDDAVALSVTKMKHRQSKHQQVGVDLKANMNYGQSNIRHALWRIWNLTWITADLKSTVNPSRIMADLRTHKHTRAPTCMVIWKSRLLCWHCFENTPVRLIKTVVWYTIVQENTVGRQFLIANAGQSRSCRNMLQHKLGCRQVSCALVSFRYRGRGRFHIVGA